MARYIDAEKIKYTKFIPENDPFDGAGGLCALKSHIDAIPAADVVQVVRCKDCAVPHNRWTGCPKLNGLVTPPDFYCSYGERRKEDGDA